MLLIHCIDGDQMFPNPDGNLELAFDSGRLHVIDDGGQTIAIFASGYWLRIDINPDADEEPDS